MKNIVSTTHFYELQFYFGTFELFYVLRLTFTHSQRIDYLDICGYRSYRNQRLLILI